MLLLLLRFGLSSPTRTIVRALSCIRVGSGSALGPDKANTYLFIDWRIANFMIIPSRPSLWPQLSAATLSVQTCTESSASYDSPFDRPPLEGVRIRAQFVPHQTRHLLSRLSRALQGGGGNAGRTVDLNAAAQQLPSDGQMAC